MTCECQVCKDIKHLRECGVSEEFMDRWLNEGMDNVMCYSTMAGELPKMVEKGIPRCFVEWTDYVTLQRKYEALVAEMRDKK